MWSFVTGILGMLGTAFMLARLSRRVSHWAPVRYWLLGLAALVPAWLIAFVGLLGSFTGGRPESALSASWILSASAALLGIIVTDAEVKRLDESGRPHGPLRYWLLGIAAVAPAWGIALLGFTWI